VEDSLDKKECLEKQVIAFLDKEGYDKESPRHQNKEDSNNHHMCNLVDQHQDNLKRVGMIRFRYVGLQKTPEEYLEKVHTNSLWDFESSQHKVGSIGIVPYYTRSILSEFEEYLSQVLETIRYLAKAR